MEDEAWRVRKDGSHFWTNTIITGLRDATGQLTGFAKVTRDLTERRRTEAAIEELSGRLFLLQDEERKRLAGRLHDRTSTPVASALAKLYRVREHLGDDQVTRNDINDAIREVEGVGDEIRQVAHMLHPSRLEQSGLVDTLRWYINAVSEQMGRPTEAHLPESPVKLGKEGEIVLFRLVQECLSRALDPQNVRVARVDLSVDGNASLEIRIQGSAHGGMLETMQRRRSDIGLGFSGLRERVRRLGGTFKVSQGETTSIVEATLPTKS